MQTSSSAAEKCVSDESKMQSEKLKGVPDLLESLISEKRLLQAAVLLVKSIKTISKPDMQDVGAISDLRSYLTTQETVRLPSSC